MYSSGGIFKQDLPDQVYDTGVETLKVQGEVIGHGALCHL